MNSFTLRRFGASLAILMGIAAQTASAAPAPEANIEGIKQYRLDNGLQVLLYPDPSKPTVTVNLTVLVGSRHEGYGETGMAHLLEHMLFKGTPTHPLVPKALQERGARFNGTTWVDRTNYYETMPATDDNLEFALRLEADRMVNSNVKREDLMSEMTVVRNEFERGENSPPALLSQRITSVAFDWHNYGKSTIGNRSDIERVPIERLKQFYVKYYQPDNAVLVVAGKFDEAKARTWVQKYFGALPRPKRKLDNTYTEEPAQDGERFVTLRRVGDVALVGAAYHVPSGPHPDAAALEVLAGVLDLAPAGRLYKALVETHKATDVSADMNTFHDAGLLEITAEVRRGDSLEAARDILLKVVEGLGKQKISSEEVARVKQRILKQRELAAADTGAIAIELSNWAAQGDWRLYFLHRDRIEEVTPADVQRVAQEYLRRNNRTLGLFIPTETPEKTPIPETPALAKMLDGYKGREQLALGEAFDVSPANIDARTQKSTLAEGIKLALLPKKTRGQTVQIRIELHYGNLENLKGFQTAADFLPHVMVRGTKQLTRQQIQDELDKNRAVLTVTGETGTAVFTVETKRANVPAVLALLRQVLREPTLPADELEVLRRQQLAGLEAQLTDPQSLATVRVRRTVSPYDKQDVRYSPTPQEEIQWTKDMTRKQLETLRDEFLGAQAGEVAVVGDFDPAQVTPALREIFSSWTGKKPYERIPKKFFPHVSGANEQILTPDKANAVFVAGIVFPMKDQDPDYPSLVIGNYIFGSGGLSSRLADRVRQKEGLSYGVGSFLASETLDPRTSMTIYAICNPENIKKVDVAILEELKRLLKDGVTTEELDRAKRGYLQQQQVARSSDSNLASILTDNLFVDRTMAYYADVEKKIAALTPADVATTLKKRIDPERLVVVTAGDFAPGAKKTAQPPKQEGAARRR